MSAGMPPRENAFRIGTPQRKKFFFQSRYQACARNFLAQTHKSDNIPVLWVLILRFVNRYRRSHNQSDHSKSAANKSSQKDYEELIHF